MKHVNKISYNIRTGIIVVIIGLLGGIFVKLFMISWFVVPTSSMASALYCGDCILVNKWRYSSPFNDYKRRDSIKNLANECGKIKRNDIIVFHSPWNKELKKIEINRNLFWVKRCIALPGDTINIIKGRYMVNREKNCGDTSAQIKFYRNRIAYSGDQIFEGQQDSLIKWTLWNYGPLIIPGKGVKIELTPQNRLIYGKMIKYEDIDFEKGSSDEYVFKGNWYFMAGDNVANSFDSRYWGCMPEECIVGKAFMVIFSRNLSDGEYRKERFFKKLY